MKKLIFITFFFLVYSLSSFAESAYFIDFKKVLNSSKSGAEAQKKLIKRFETETKKFKELDKNIRKEESQIISQKNILSPEEYKKKVGALRKKVSESQKKKQESFSSIAKSRNDSKKILIDALNPILKKYMEDNNIKLILDKKNVIMGDKNLEITDQIISILNKEVLSLKIN